MKTFGIIAMGLSLLSVGASAQETTSLTRTLKITTDQVVTTLQMPPITTKGEQTLSIEAAKIERNRDTYVFNGHVVLNYGEGFKVTSDKASKDLKNEKIIMSGNVVIQYEQDGKQIVRIVAENAVLETNI